MTQKPEVNQDECIGCTTCVSACPVGELFAMNDENKAFFKPESVDSCCENQECVRNCPVQCIHMVDRS
ncbi:4Fe4S ferredoxin [Blattamonas nauphoetae]|uniref:4Fe4S ferredoxin n=1 Tax=Blattamonas nauphoetae TaxID=2049346 RepID=A0ABQ9X6L9_9EUKA|nr:4Fe4S ferredoxin [Blattamonas nauphoetae]